MVNIISYPGELTTTSATNRARTAYPSGGPEFIPEFCGVRVG